MKRLLKLNADLGNEITFINAWNEWGEGMYLEPDKKNSFAFLEATKRALESYTNENIDHDIENDKKILLTFYKNKMEQYKKNWLVLEQWMQRKEHKEPLRKTLEKMKITSVAIYGLGMFGTHLKAELEDSDIIIKYAIDIRKEGIVQELPVLGLNDDFPEVDAIIVSVVNEFDIIAEQLREKTNIPVISLEKILFEQECTEL